MTRRTFVASGAVALGATVVWTSPYPFSDKSIGRLLDSAEAATTEATGTSSSGTPNSSTTAGPSGELEANGANAGRVAIFNGQDYVSWQGGAFGPALVGFSHSQLTADTGGFALGSSVFSLTVTGNAGPITKFDPPLVIHIADAGGLIPAFSEDGKRWSSISLLRTPLPNPFVFPLDVHEGYVSNSDGSIDIYTDHLTYFGILRDIEGPTAPGALRGRFDRGALILTWTASTDNSGVVDRYELTLNGAPVATYPGADSAALVRAIEPHGSSVYGLRATDPSGNIGQTSNTVTVVPRKRPQSAPHEIPDWAFKLLAWQERPPQRRGIRPTTPLPVPRWYWTWKRWRLEPFRVVQ